MIFSAQQEAALKAVDRWFYHDSKQQQVFRVMGYAGTGKTTLAKSFAEGIEGEVIFAAFTGKAALVMRKNGCKDARTLHSLIYRAIQHNDGSVTFDFNVNSDAASAALIIIDECSMVDKIMAGDLMSFGVPILVLGDPAQLPPVDGAGYFTEADPDVMLTEIHRQSADNPIIYLANQIRLGHIPPVGNYGESRVIANSRLADAKDADMVICGRNITRASLNSRIRKLHGFTGEDPQKDEKLICLKNDSTLQIFNGGTFTVSRIIEPKYPTQFLYMSLLRDDEGGYPAIVKVHKSFFQAEASKPDWKVLRGSQEFDFAYAITCHKAQGSQWDNVLVYDENYCFRDMNLRWLYTAVTRASERLTIVKM